MGVPKFFRYISERYPCLSEIIKEYQIPEYDNLYLDMNGIIHTCSHPDDGDPHFRITEENIFKDIFHYIEVLFRMIKPQKLFFMAVDGVAPRAKMNQQRGRRFRSAKEAQVLENKARERGEDLPKEERFDSNCITPGTAFMIRLHEQLKYFVVDKISSDKLWRNCKIILSGHETPGEGEHKIMDYIRYMRAQPAYDPNTRHCLYGLDADLIMLGLCTHEPHFSLLREEVRFGRKSNKKKSIPEQITFYLLHLSLMREYLELEFYPLKESLKFDYDMEKIIDDWVLMGFLVGNDFIPHLPNLHINNGALPILYSAYMKVLPKLGGYINEGGTLNLHRFDTFVQELASLDLNSFTETYADLKWFEGKTGRRLNTRKTEKRKPDTDNIDSECETLKTKTINSDLADLIQRTAELMDNTKKESCASSDNEDDLFTAEFVQHKTEYYMNKLDFANVTPEVLQSQAEEYVRAIQWNLNYYYNGVCSWSWFYPHHYAPYVSDVKNFSNLVLTFELGEPFKPYEQLLAVLPSASMALLPVPFQELMISEDSPIKAYYPEDFETDLNGKKQEWEAVVLIPFINEDILLKAMQQCSHRLTQEEVSRNGYGPMLVYQFTRDDLGEYLAPLYFPPVENSHAHCAFMSIEDIRIPRNKLIKGAYPGAEFDVYYPGFPTLKHLKYKGCLEKAKVKVFDQPSRSENMILHILNEEQVEEEVPTGDTLANEFLGKSVHVGWPHLTEALVVSISTQAYRYESVGEEGQYNVEDNKGNRVTLWNMSCQGITEYYRNHLGVNVGETETLVHVKTMIGRKYVFSQNQRISFEKQWADISSVYPLQTVVRNISVHETKHATFKNIESVFRVGSTCFMLGHPGYGLIGEVMEGKEALKSGRVKLCFKAPEEPDLSHIAELDNQLRVCFVNLYVASTKLSISRGLFSRLTGGVFVSPGQRSSIPSEDVSRVNIGLNLKFNKKNEEIPGYTRKDGNTWLYSEKAIAVVNAYLQRYPEIADYIDANVGDEVYYEAELFPKGNSKEVLSDITSWVKQQPYYAIERQVCGSSVTYPEIIQSLEVAIKEINKSSQKVKQMTMQVKPHLLFKPGLQIGNLMPDPAATFLLYDRVVNIREGYSVPSGLRGTIIGLHKSSTVKDEEITFDVLFDEPFAGGLSVNGCSPNRAYRMSKPSLINLTHGQRVFQQKTNGNVPNQSMPSWNHHAPPSFPVNLRPDSRQVAWPQNTALHMVPPMPSFNPYFNYNAPPGFVHQGPNTFVPYKGSHFPLGHPQPLMQASNSYQPSPMMPPNMSTFAPPIVVPNGGIPYGKQLERHIPMFNNKVQESPPPRNDSEFLKRILKIEPNSSPSSSNTKLETLQAPESETLTYYTVQLLQHFQTRKLGCPNYQLFEVNNKFTAKITMPDGTYVFGQPAKIREHASENAAKEALSLLRTPEVPNKTMLENNSSKDLNVDVTCKSSPVRPKLAANTVQSQIWKHLNLEPHTERPKNDFLPFQAVHNQKTATNLHANTVIDSTVPQSNKMQEPLQPTKTVSDVLPSNPPIKRRERKMRIAANFQTAMTKEN